MKYQNFKDYCINSEIFCKQGYYKSFREFVSTHDLKKYNTIQLASGTLINSNHLLCKFFIFTLGNGIFLALVDNEKIKFFKILSWFDVHHLYATSYFIDIFMKENLINLGYTLSNILYYVKYFNFNVDTSINVYKDCEEIPNVLKYADFYYGGYFYSFDSIYDFKRNLVDRDFMKKYNCVETFSLM